MTDRIVERLRACANGIGDFKSAQGDYGICDDAADLLEEAEAALERVKERCFQGDDLNWQHDILSIVVPLLDAKLKEPR